ncbi:MAG TPA: adenosylcobinamide-GDP ribazoletransferase [Bryobacterales bacterium]|nr:adenosylcobinamide-GDP ribazoletransferase [Bryobacterales bacterium]
MISALLTAFQTLTRIRVPSPRRAPDAAVLGASAIFYPFVGAVIGVAGFGLYRLLSDVLPRDIIMLGVLAFWVLLTGALHEDGLADTCDAFGSQSRPDQILRVMKDSAIGTYGAVGLVLTLLLRWRTLAAIGPEYTLPACLLSQMLPRAGIAPLAFWIGPASGGTGGSFAAGLRLPHVIGSVALSGVVLMPLMGDWRLILGAAAACAVVILVLGLYFRRRLGGVTGDCLGTAVQFQELGVLLTVLIWTTG